MKNKVLTGFCAVAGLAFLSACSDTFNPSGDREGRILPSIGLDPVVAAPQGKAAARADGQAMQISPDDLKLTLSADDGSLERTWESPADFDPAENFPVGAYTMEASYGDADLTARIIMVRPVSVFSKTAPRLSASPRRSAMPCSQ